VNGISCILQPKTPTISSAFSGVILRGAKLDFAQFTLRPVDRAKDLRIALRHRSCLPLSPPLLYFSIARSPSWLSFSQIRGRVVYHFIKRRERFKNTCQLHLCLLKEINDHT
jgi:hypothetical protein